MSKYFVSGGGLRVDYLITPEGKAHVRMPGGNALYAAVGVAIWQENIAVWARKGENFPDAWLQEVANLGIDLQQICKIPGNQEHRTFFAYTSASTRTDTEPENILPTSVYPCQPNSKVMSTLLLLKMTPTHSNLWRYAHLIGSLIYQSLKIYMYI